MSFPTDLSSAELELAQARLSGLAEEFTAEETLRTPRWREVFTRTWRHLYVPSYYPELGALCLLCIDPQRRSEWLRAVHSNQTLITKVVQVPLSRTLQPGTQPMFTSSSTLPSLVLTMLEALEVTNGCRVLEIGTGSGYNAALLCERLGSEQVTSVDVDPELVDLARERLAVNGYTPILAVADGAGGYSPGAPYDRIVATCSVPAIPPVWLDQAAANGMILADVRGKIGGTVARFTVDSGGRATGRFLPSWAGFMPLRHTVDFAPPELVWEADGEPVDSVTEVDPILLQSDRRVGCVVQWHVPDASWGQLAENGAVSIHLSAPDGSRASVRSTRTDGGFRVSQVGPRRLWDRVEEAYEFWQRARCPSFDRFGVTATATEQYVWFDDPDSEHRWPLPAPPRR